MEQDKKNELKDYAPYLTTKDFLVSEKQFELLLDKEREMLITNPQPKTSELPKYYESKQYISHTDAKKGLFNFLYQTVKKYSLQKKTKLIHSLNGGVGRLLDIGAGTGDFLLAAKKKGWVTSGVEVNPQARLLAKEKGQDLKESIDEGLNEKFDLVTLWHVLEHLPNLEDTTRTIESLVKNGGHLIVAVPNYKSFDAKHYKEYWAGYDVPRHLWHFSRKTMNNLFSSKMELVNTQPMKFDAYYVSLLSEKYKSGKKLSLKAFWIGLLSNLKAKRSKEYSSLIYIFKKG